MKQNFDVRGGPQAGLDNLPKLRAELARQCLDGFYIPHEDEYQNEYLPAANERLAWISGFTGSYGSALILASQAALFVDGRYTLQAEQQTDADLFERIAVPDPGPFGWLSRQQFKDKVIGYDPALITPNEAEALSRAARDAGASVQAVTDNPIDNVWTGRPAQPQAMVYPHPLEFAGTSARDKRVLIAQTLEQDGADAVIITAPASLAWLFNIRGGDVAFSPLPLGRAIVYADGRAELFLDRAKCSQELHEHLGNTVTLQSSEQLTSCLSGLKGRTVSLDPASASAWFFQTLKEDGARILHRPDPTLLPKACKNAVEIAGSKAAHQRDGIAVTRFLHWLDTTAQSGNVSEIDAACMLETFRSELSGFEDLSFETISGAGPNSAMPHYRVSSASNRLLERGSLYLADSGGQYRDGTTDVTRTVAIGTPTGEMRHHYSLVLKGHVALATARFPNGTTGTHLDGLARNALWKAGLDYDHGTGHGVGVFLGVHEGPQRIARQWNSVPLAPGMIVSNEPGFYKQGAYGIRIENLQYVTPPNYIEGGERAMLGFECLTFAPLARNLIDTAMLTTEERHWINHYHSRVLAKIQPGLDGTVADWLANACRPL